MENSLTETYEHIWKNYFPLFDRKKKWVVEYSNDIPSLGYCDRINKKILVARINDQIEISVTIVHEICHAVSNDYHGKIWHNRIAKVAELLERKGEKDLSVRLWQEIKVYKKSEKFTAQEVYNVIENYVIDSPQSSCDAIVNQVSREFGFYPDEFKRRFILYKKVFEEQKELIKKRVIIRGQNKD